MDSSSALSAPSAQQDVAVELGFINPAVIKNLKNHVHWKMRASAIEELQTLVTELRDATPIRPHTGDILALLIQLLDDPNFKISLTTLHILADVVQKLGASIIPFVDTITPKLIEKWGDNKIVVRQATTTVMANVTQIMRPSIMFPRLLRALGSSNWHIKEETINFMIGEIPNCRQSEFLFDAIIAALMAPLCDDNSRVKVVANEAFNVIVDTIGFDALIQRLDTHQQQYPQQYSMLRERYAAMSAPNKNASVNEIHFPNTPLLVTSPTDPFFPSHTPTMSPTAKQQRVFSTDSSFSTDTSSPDTSDVPPPISFSNAMSPRSNSAAGIHKKSANKINLWLPSSTSMSDLRASTEITSVSSSELASPKTDSARKQSFFDTQDIETKLSLIKRRQRTMSKPSSAQRSANSSIVEEDHVTAGGSASLKPPTDVSPPTGANPRNISINTFEFPTSQRRKSLRGSLSTDTSPDSPGHRLAMASVYSSISVDDSNDFEGDLSENTIDSGVSFNSNQYSSNHTSGRISSGLYTRANQRNRPQLYGAAEHDIQTNRNHYRNPMMGGNTSFGTDDSTSLQNGVPQQNLDDEYYYNGGASTYQQSTDTNHDDDVYNAVSIVDGRSASGFTSRTSSGGRRGSINRAHSSGTQQQPSSSLVTREDADWSEANGPHKGSKLAGSAKSVGSSTGSVGSGGWEEVASVDLKPSLNPAKELNEALDLLAVKNGSWEDHSDAITSIRRLSIHHAKDIVLPKLHPIMLLVLAYADNLRSALSKNALICLEDMLTSLTKAMDLEVEGMIPVLLKKASETNKFINVQAERVLLSMVMNTTEQKTILQLLQHSNHKNGIAKSKVAMLVCASVEQMGRRIFTITSVSDKVITTTVQFLNEASAETRNWGRRLSYRLHVSYYLSNGLSFPSSETDKPSLAMVPTAATQSLERLLKRLLNDRQIKQLRDAGQSYDKSPEKMLSIREIVERDRTHSTPGSRGRVSSASSSSTTTDTSSKQQQSDSGLSISGQQYYSGGSGSGYTITSTIPNELSIGGSQPLLTKPGSRGSRGSDLQNVAGLMTTGTALINPNVSGKREVQRPSRVKSANDSPLITRYQDNIPKILTSMGSSDWKERYSGITELLELMVGDSSPTNRDAAFLEAINPHLLRIFDHLIPRLSDANSKVNLHALQALRKMLPLLKNSLEPVLNRVLETVSNASLGSNAQIRIEASELFGTLTQNVSHSLILHNLLPVLYSVNVRAKAMVLSRMSELARSAHSEKPTLLVKYVIPTCLRVYNTEPKGEQLRTPMSQLFKSIYKTLGEELFTTPNLSESDAKRIREWVLSS